MFFTLRRPLRFRATSPWPHPLEKNSKNVDFRLWGKQCIVLPKGTFFRVLAHCVCILLLSWFWYSDADYTICIRKLWSYKSLNCPSFCSIKVGIIQLLRELHKFRDFGTYYVALMGPIFLHFDFLRKTKKKWVFLRTKNKEKWKKNFSTYIPINNATNWNFRK